MGKLSAEKHESSLTSFVWSDDLNDMFESSDALMLRRSLEHTNNKSAFNQAKDKNLTQGIKVRGRD